MLWYVAARFQDFNGDIAETRQIFDANGPIDGLFASISAWSSAIETLSDARLIDGYARVSFPPTVPSSAQVSSNVFRRLLVLCRNGDDLASISIPSPRALPYEVSGPYRNFRIPENQISAVNDIQNLISVLSGTVTRFNKPFPTDRAMVALLENQL